MLSFKQLFLNEIENGKLESKKGIGCQNGYNIFFSLKENGERSSSNRF